MRYDFESSFKFIDDKNIDVSFSEQVKVLKSKDFNLAFNKIENNLNLMYEKIRTLEDIMKYSDIYIKNEINSNIEECKQLMLAIEDNRDSVKKNGFINYSVPLIFGVSASADRDGQALSECDLLNSNLVPNSSVLTTYSINPFEILYSNINNCLGNDFKKLNEEKNYRSFYMFSEKQGKHIFEELVFKYPRPIKINRIDFTSTNCDVYKIIIKDDNSKSHIIDTNDISNFETINAEEIRISIKTKRYSLSNFDYREYNENKTEFWDNYNKEYLYDNSKDSFYYYIFGLDDLKFEFVKNSKASFFSSKNISIGSLKNHEYISLMANGIGNIEYSIINDIEEIPMLPEGVSTIVDERIFYKMPLRFAFDATKDVLIKCNNKIVNLSLYDAMNKNDGKIYTASYTPIPKEVTNIGNGDVQLKVIMRHDLGDISPSLNKIIIKKKGGGTNWIDDLKA